MKRLAIALSLSVLLLAGCGGNNKTTVPVNGITVGAMLEQTGSLTDFTPEFTAACQLAVEDENTRLADAGATTHFSLSIRDTASTTAGAAAAITAFSNNDVHFVLGPRTSAQCQSVLPIAQANDIAFLAPRSVADDLSLPNDALFRLISPDREVIPLVAQTALGRGMKSMCVLYRNDVFGTNALAILDTTLQAAGGDVVYSQAYNAATGPSDAELQMFADAVIAQRAIHGAETGVAYFSLSEMVAGFAELNAQPDTFRTVGAVAAQSLANIPSMVTNNEAKAYCGASNFQAVAFALANQPAINLPAGEALLNRIAARSGKTNPDELSINVYDGMRALLRAAQRNNATHIGAVNAELGASPAGTLAPMHFDANGDRLGDFFGVYQIDQVESSWVRTATLTP